MGAEAMSGKLGAATKTFRRKLVSTKRVPGEEEKDVVSIWRVLKFSFQIAAFGALVGAVPEICWWGWEYTIREKFGLYNELFLALKSSDRYNHEVIVLGNVTVEGQLSMMAGLLPFGLLPAFSFFPFLWFAYLTSAHFPWRWGLFVVASSVAVVFVCAVGEIDGEFSFALVLNLLLTTAMLQFAFGSKQKYAKRMLYQIGIFAVGMIFSNLSHRFPQDQGFTLLLFCFFYPLGRDLIRHLSVLTAWYLAVDGDAINDNVAKIDRGSTWLFVAWTQVFFAVYFRILVVNMGNPTLAIIVILWQALSEIVLRLTVEHRDTALKNARRKICCQAQRVDRVRGRKETNVHPVDLVNRKIKTVIDVETKRRVAKYNFYSQVILVDMVSEYVGIFSSCIGLAWAKSMPFVYPYPMYAVQDLDKDIDVAPILGAFAFQFVCEVLVDTFCTMRETRSNALAAWTFLMKSPVKTTFYFTLCSIFGRIMAHAVVLVSENFSECAGRDLCFCVDNGLVKGNPREQYCQLIYPDTNGKPPQL